METIDPIPDIEIVNDTLHRVFIHGRIFIVKHEFFEWHIYIENRKDEDEKNPRLELKTFPDDEYESAITWIRYEAPSAFKEGNI